MEINYDKYKLTGLEALKYLLFSVSLVVALGFLFYKSIIAMIFLAPLGIIYIKIKKKSLLRKRKEQFNLQFKDALLAASAVLQAGYSVENSFVHAYKEMCSLHGEKSLISRELKIIINNINLNIPLEKSLENLAYRTGIEDVGTFAEVFMIAKRCGGDMIKIISRATDEICDKADVKSEIQTVISAKKFEKKIMNFMPLLIILYVNGSSQGMLDSLYYTPLGIVVMTICLGVYGLAFYLGEKIVRIEV